MNIKQITPYRISNLRSKKPIINPRQRVAFHGNFGFINFGPNRLSIKNLIIDKITPNFIKEIRNLEEYVFKTLDAPNSIENIPEGFKTLKSKVNEVIIKTRDGIKLKCWDVPPEGEKPYVLLCHGLNSNLDENIPVLDLLAKKGYGVFGLEYRGYAGHAGVSSQKGHRLDTDAAIKYLRSKKVPRKDIGIMGISMGGAVAVDLASRHKNLKFLAIISSFTTTAEMGKYFLSIDSERTAIISKTLKKLVKKIPNWLVPLKNPYNSKYAIKKVNYPILIVHSRMDKLIPYWMSESLAEAARETNEMVKLHILPMGGHVTMEKKAPIILKFMDSLD